MDFRTLSDESFFAAANNVRRKSIWQIVPQRLVLSCAVLLLCVGGGDVLQAEAQLQISLDMVGYQKEMLERYKNLVKEKTSLQDRNEALEKSRTALEVARRQLADERDTLAQDKSLMQEELVYCRVVGIVGVSVCVCACVCLFTSVNHSRTQFV